MQIYAHIYRLSTIIILNNLNIYHNNSKEFDTNNCELNQDRIKRVKLENQDFKKDHLNLY